MKVLFLLHSSFRLKVHNISTNHIVSSYLIVWYLMAHIDYWNMELLIFFEVLSKKIKSKRVVQPF